MKNEEFSGIHTRPLVKSLLVLWVGMLAVAIPGRLSAQMFSVDSEERDRSDPESALYIGVEIADFDFKGSLDPQDPSAGLFAFSGPLLKVRFERRGLNIYLASGGSVTGLDEVNYLDFGIKSDFGFSLVENEKISLEIPVGLMLSFNNATNRNVVTNTAFRQTSLVPAAGLDVTYRPGNNFRLSLDAKPGYGYSFSGGGTFGGGITTFEGRLRMYFDELLGNLGFTIGYDFNLKSFDIDQEQFDYDLASHGILAGISF